MNGYAYSSNSPISKSDPSGLMENADGMGSAPCTKPGGCVRDDPGKSNLSGKWESEGSAQLDYNGDGYIAIYPTVRIEAKWNKANAYIDAFYEQIDRLCTFRDGCTDTSIPVNSVTINNTKGHACIAAGRNCPAGSSYGASAAMADLALLTADGGEGPAGGMAFGSNRKSKKSADCNQCFLAGTDVLLADGTSKDIEEIEVGDEVLATDPETGETGPRKVARLIVTEDDKHFNELSIATDNGTEKLTATYEHPFWVPELGQWVAARDLAIGMHLRKPDGSTATVSANSAFSKHARTYNLTVEDLHTYYVLAGATPVLVHNSNCTPEILDQTYRSANTPAKLEHVIDPEKHGFSDLVERSGGREQAMRRIVDSLGDVDDLPQAGRFEVGRTVDGESVTIRGAVVNGVPRLGTAFIPGKFPGS